MMDPPKAYRVNEAARQLGVSRNTIYRLIESGELKSRKALGRRIIPRDAIDAFLKAGEAA